MKLSKKLKAFIAVTLSATLVAGSLMIFPIHFAKADDANLLKNADGSVYTAVYNGLPQEPTVNVFDGEYIIPSTEYNTPTYTDNVNAGMAHVTVTDKDGGNYTLETVTYDFEITAKPVDSPTIILSYDSIAYNGSSQKPTVTVKDGDSVIDSNEYSISYSNQYNSITQDDNTTDVGTITITITDAKTGSSVPGANGNYEIATTSKTYSIVPADNTLTLASSSGDLDFLESGTIDITANTSGGELSVDIDDGDIATVTVEDVTNGKAVGIQATKVGGATVTLNSAATRNYNAGSATYALTVNPINMTVSSTDGESTYNGEAQTLGSVTVSSPSTYNIVYSAPLTGTTTTPDYSNTTQPAIIEAGNYYVYYKITADNYNDYTGSYTVTMNRAKTATATAKENLIYSGDPQLGVDSQFVSLSNEYGTNADTYTATATPDSNHAWSDGTTVSKDVEFTIHRADNSFDMSASSGTVVYKQSVTIDLSNNVSGGVFSVQSGNNNIATATLDENVVTIVGTGVGSTTITVTTAETANYNAKSETYDIEVTRATLTGVTATDGEAEYDGDTHVLGSVTVSDKKLSGADESYAIWYSDPMQTVPDTITYTHETKPGISTAGTYTVYYKITSDNYADYTGSYTVKLTKKANTIAVGTIQNKVFNDADFLVALSNSGYETGTVTWSIESGNASINGSTGLVHITGVGTVTVKASMSETTNYEPCSATATFTVSAAPINVNTITIDASVTPGTYNGAEQTPIITVIDTTITTGDSRRAVLSEGVDFTVTYPLDMTNAGTKSYNIVGIGNYAGTSATQNYTIDPLSINGAMITASSTSAIYNSNSYTPTLTIINAFDVGNNPIQFEFGNLTAGADYTIEYTQVIDGQESARTTDAPINVGTYKAYVIGTGNYNITGEANPVTFNISQCSVANGNTTVVYAVDEYEYNGTSQEVYPEVTWVQNNGGTQRVLTVDSEYTVALSGDTINVTDAGVTATVTGKGNFTGVATSSYSIIPYDVATINDPNVTITETDTPIYMTGTEINYPDHILVTSLLGTNHTLTRGTDYTLAQTDATDPNSTGTVTMVLTFTGNYVDAVGPHTYTAQASYLSNKGTMASYDPSTGTITISGGTGNIDDDIINRIAATGATKIVIGSNAGTITVNAFRGQGSDALTSITATNDSGYSASSPFLLSGDGAILIATLPYVSGDVTVPEGVTTIVINAFKGCDDINTITFPSSLQTIEAGAFTDTAIKEVTIYATTTYEENEFGDSLEKLTVIGDTTTTTWTYFTTDNGDGTVTKTTTKTITNNTDGAFVQSVETRVVTDTSTGNVVSKTTITTEPTSSGGTTIITVYEPTPVGGVTTTVTTTEIQNDLGQTVSIKEVTVVKEVEIVGTDEITTTTTTVKEGTTPTNLVTTSEDQTKTKKDAQGNSGASAHYDALTGTLTISGGTGNIDSDIKYYVKVTGATHIIIGDNAGTITQEAFRGPGSTALTTIAATVDSGYSATYPFLLSADGKTLIAVLPGATGNIVVPDGVITIKSGAFKDCTGITTITLPESVQTVEDGAFEGTALQEITVCATTTYSENEFGDSWTKFTIIGDEETTVWTRTTVDNGDNTKTNIITAVTTDTDSGEPIKTYERRETVDKVTGETISVVTTTTEVLEDGGEKVTTVTETSNGNTKTVVTLVVIKDDQGNVTSVKKTTVVEETSIVDGNTVVTTTTTEQEGTSEAELKTTKVTEVKTTKDPQGELLLKVTTTTVYEDDGTKVTIVAEGPYAENGRTGTSKTTEHINSDSGGKEYSYDITTVTTISTDGTTTERTIECVYTTTQDENGNNVRTLVSKTEVIKVTIPTEEGYNVTTTTNIYDPNNPDKIKRTLTEIIDYTPGGQIIRKRTLETDVTGADGAKYGHLILESASGQEEWEDSYGITAEVVELPQEDNSKIKQVVKTAPYDVIDVNVYNGLVSTQIPYGNYTMLFGVPADWPASSTVTPKVYWYDDATGTMDERPAEFVKVDGTDMISTIVNHCSYYVVTYTVKPTQDPPEQDPVKPDPPKPSGGGGSSGSGESGGTILTTYTVKYVDGVEDETIFEDQVYELKRGSDTPAFYGTPVREGYTFTGWTPEVSLKVIKDVTYVAQWEKNEEPEPTDPEPVKPKEPLIIKIFRLFNPWGFHLFTVDLNERDYLMSLGWNLEGIGFSTTDEATVPVYRVYNPNNGDHLFTANKEERDHIVPLGWIYEGVAFKAFKEGVPMHRLYNPYSGEHFYTRVVFERDLLMKLGWNYEGIACYMKE